jgi:hypothetical protein
MLIDFDGCAVFNACLFSMSQLRSVSMIVAMRSKQILVTEKRNDEDEDEEEE